mmetsp:Transcript_12214/g.28668  ORF Transcript_12214/g.28668 Transcript_12214/m.28668 type:complete len:266 (-) Transcript_12214:1075-1872(-)
MAAVHPPGPGASPPSGRKFARWRPAPRRPRRARWTAAVSRKRQVTCWGPRPRRRPRCHRRRPGSRVSRVRPPPQQPGPKCPRWRAPARGPSTASAASRRTAPPTRTTTTTWSSPSRPAPAPGEAEASNAAARVLPAAAAAASTARGMWAVGRPGESPARWRRRSRRCWRRCWRWSRRRRRRRRRRPSCSSSPGRRAAQRRLRRRTWRPRLTCGRRARRFSWLFGPMLRTCPRPSTASGTRRATIRSVSDRQTAKSTTGRSWGQGR